MGEPGARADLGAEAPTRVSGGSRERMPRLWRCDPPGPHADRSGPTVTSPTPRRDENTLRGAIVLVVAIVIGLALLARSGGDGSEEASATTESASSTTEFDGSTSTSGEVGPIASESTTTTTVPEGPGDTRPPAEVTVIILNGTSANVEGIAADNEAKVVAAGYETLSATGAFVDLSTTTIYADAEFQADAEAVKGVLGIPDAVIEEKPAEAPGPNGDLADVVVVIGDDAAG